MAKDVRGMLKAFSEGSREIGGERPEVMGAFSGFVKAAEGNGVLGEKMKELTAMVYGGGPTMAYISATLMPCVDEFEKDFQ